MVFWWVFFAAVNVQVQVFKEMIGRLSKGNRADHEPFVQAVPWELEAAVWRHVQLSVMCHAAGLLPSSCSSLPCRKLELSCSGRSKTKEGMELFIHL